MKNMLWAVLFLSTSLFAQTTYLTGQGGCGNSLSCWNIPVENDNGATLSFWGVSLSNGVPGVAGALWEYNGQEGSFTSASIPDWPNPVPYCKAFTFHLHLSSEVFSTNLTMVGDRCRYGVYSFYTPNGMLTVN